MSQFVNIFEYQNKDFPFQIFIGGRGTGKTYSALAGSIDKSVVPGKFIFMRRTQNELETLLDDEKKGEGANPYKKLNSDKNVNYGFRKINDNIAGIYTRVIGDNGKLQHVGEPEGYGVALSTISSIRGVDFSDCSDWFYDEFIKEKHVRALKEEGEALLNAYETVNRNREFFDEPPIRLWLLANSNDIYNPIFTALGIVAIVERMNRNGQRDCYLKDRGLAIHLLQASQEFVEKKKETALYKLTKGTRFYDMSLENKFAYNDFSLIGYKKLHGFTCWCKVGKAYIYKKKGDAEIYVSYAASNRVVEYKTEESQDLIRFRREVGVRLYPYFVEGRLFFESYELKESILQLIL